MISLQKLTLFRKSKLGTQVCIIISLGETTVFSLVTSIGLVEDSCCKSRALQGMWSGESLTHLVCKSGNKQRSKLFNLPLNCFNLTPRKGETFVPHRVLCVPACSQTPGRQESHSTLRTTLTGGTEPPPAATLLLKKPAPFATPWELSLSWHQPFAWNPGMLQCHQRFCSHLVAINIPPPMRSSWLG